MIALLESISHIAIAGIQLIDPEALAEMLVRFAFNFLFVLIIVRFFYYPRSKRRDYFFAFIMLSASIFMMIYFMDGAKMKVGAALGLFAVFGIIRYRTEAVPIREMTYLFFIVALSVVNGMSSKLSIAELLIANMIFIFVAKFTESSRLIKRVACKYVRYDNINLITPEKREDMIEDLKKRTGLNIIKVEMGSIDFMRDTALIKIYYEDADAAMNDANTLQKLPKNYE